MIWAIFMGIVGVCLIVMPRSWMLWGSPWRFKNPDNLEPSDAYVAYTRISGIALTVVTAGIIIAVLVAQADRARRDQLDDLWHVELRTSDQIVLTTDPDIVEVDEFPEDLADGELSFGSSRTAVVGRDDLGDIGDTSALHDGDLLVSLGYTACAFSHLIVVQDSERVAVRIIVELPHHEPIPGLPIAEPGPVDEIWEGIEQMNHYTLCLRRFIPDDDDVGLRVIRVPLDEPLGDRIVE